MFCHLLKLFEFQRAVVHSGRQSETIFHKIDFSRTVSPIHCTDLGYAHVAFVDNDQEIIRKEIEQTIGAGTGSTAVEITGVILNSGTMSQFPDHLHIVSYSLIQSLGLVFFADRFEESYLLGQIILYFMNSAESSLFGSHEQVGRINLIGVKWRDSDSCDGVYLFDTVNLISPEGDTEQVVGISQINIHRVALDPEISTVQVNIIADIQAVYQTT